MKYCIWCDIAEHGAGPYWSDNPKRDSQTRIAVDRGTGKKSLICAACGGPAEYYYGEEPTRPPKRKRKGKRNDR